MIKMLICKINNNWRKSSFSLDSLLDNKDAAYWLKTVGYIKINEAEYYDADRN